MGMGWFQSQSRMADCGDPLDKAEKKFTEWDKLMQKLFIRRK
jgi:hypothetical protein